MGWLEISFGFSVRCYKPSFLPVLDAYHPQGCVSIFEDKPPVLSPPVNRVWVRLLWMACSAHPTVTSQLPVSQMLPFLLFSPHSPDLLIFTAFAKSTHSQAVTLFYSNWARSQFSHNFREASFSFYFKTCSIMEPPPAVQRLDIGLLCETTLSEVHLLPGPHLLWMLGGISFNFSLVT